MLTRYQDPELWFPDGDCLIHLYEQGHSKRGASLRLSSAEIEASNCGSILDRYLRTAVLGTPSSSSDSDTHADAQEHCQENGGPAKYDMYIPAPTHLSREEAFRYHLTTRNFFAWMFNRPVVGEHLGDSLISLYEWICEYRPDREANEDDILAYIDRQGYTDFRDCHDHALAILRFSEGLELSELWTDAFVHCVGMWENLDQGNEFDVRCTTNF